LVDAVEQLQRISQQLKQQLNKQLNKQLNNLNGDFKNG